MSYTAQELNRKITFQQFTEVQDPVTGDVSATWADFISVFAKVEPLVGREYFAAQAVQAENSAKFTMRFRGDLLPSMRLVHEGQNYDISSIVNIKGGNRETLIVAKATA